MLTAVRPSNPRDAAIVTLAESAPDQARWCAPLLKSGCPTFSVEREHYLAAGVLQLEERLGDPPQRVGRGDRHLDRALGD